MSLPERALQEAAKRDKPEQFARRLERNFEDLDKREGTVERRLTNWKDWTPTFSNLTKGNGTIALASHARIGNSVFFRLVFILGSTSAVSSIPTFALPVEAAFSGSWNPPVIGQARYFDTSASKNYEGACELASADDAGLSVGVIGASYVERGNLSSTVPFTWDTGDQITCFGFYAASF